VYSDISRTVEGKVLEVDGWRTFRKDISLRGAKKFSGGNISNYSLDQINQAIELCTQKRTAVDVGAHIGIITTQLSKVFKYVHGFEIDHDIRPHLIYNLMKHGVTNVTIHDTGLVQTKTQVDLHKDNKSFSTHIIPNSVGKYKIQPMDDLGLQDVDFIKLDCEGYEPLVIKGAMKTIMKFKPVILYECKDHPKRYGESYHKDSVLELLSPYYRLVKRVGRGSKNAIIEFK